MYLKSIIIQGFKSFANKIVFDFPEGITGIVGPNGSGKSNVADAVRWVLGEQKIKQLRGSKMEDVIFAGTSVRKPQGYAFVAITFDNTDHRLKLDFDEVTVSRRVYRSGESEYMINGSVCRLRDVQELFYDTGIGKEGYSIIGQGQIDKILQGKPEERREIFDEAAGIVKFKKRKTMTVRKLESERGNLARVSDILSELKRQVGPLEKQSRAAEQFVVYKNELKKYDINLFLFENGDIKSKIKEHKEKEEIARNDLEQARTDFENIKVQYEELEHELAELDEKISQVRSRIARDNVIRESMSGQINVLQEQIKAARDAKAAFEDRKNSLEQQILEAGSRKEKALSDRRENQEMLTDSVKASGEQDSKVLDIQEQIEEKRKLIESLKEELISMVNERGSLNARRERLDATMEQMAMRRRELEQSIEQFSQDKAKREEETGRLQLEYENALKEEHDIKDLSEQKQVQLRENQLKIRRLEEKVNTARENMIKYQASLESLRNITERYEGYGSAIREVMKLKESHPGILGVVADIIRTDKKYETAIETALGGSIQNIITDNENTAKDAISYLKKNRLGRATFLPLQAVSGRGDFKNTGALEEKGVIGRACDLVNTDARYKGIISYLLGRILVADTVEHALVIAKKYDYSLIIVTLEGELLSRGGSITGGAFKNKSNLLGRRREMDELKASIRTLKENSEEYKKESDDAKLLEKSLSADIDALNQELQERRIYLNTLKLNLQAAREKGKEIEDLEKNIDQESKDLQQKAQNMEGENLSISGQLKQNQDDTEELKSRILKHESEIEETRKLLAEEQLLAGTLKVETSKLSSRDSFLREQVVREDEIALKLRSELTELENSNNSLDSQFEEKEGEIDNIRTSINKVEEDIESAGKELEDLETRKSAGSDSHKDFIDKREEYSRRATDLDKELFRLSSTREKLEERFENKSNYIWEEYQLTYNNALAMRDESLTDAREMRERISQLKNSIRGLGTINVGAIEEYREVKERYDFLQGQYDDLVKAEADLVKIIKDLDREMRRQFKAEFARIRHEYSKVFKEMFGGGTGDIELEEDMDILEAGITVTAQPPGKKLQNMMQLSGGEKALTAIALLFAIQNLKPSPFCILDEIEAALDDSNIIRFAGYLKKLTENVQFIVITHRKGTMEAADRLYGITMQERGVSSLISVNLSDVQDEQEELL